MGNQNWFPFLFSIYLYNMNLQESIRRILREEDRYDDKVGKTFWFEYHCYESPESCDAEIWYRSHQKVKVIGVSEWSYDDKEWRQEDGNPRVYLVEWSDGYQYDVFEDELMESPDEFHRPDPPKRKIEESLKEENIRRILREEFLNETKFFRRRIKLDEIKRILPLNAEQVYYETENYGQFKYELTLRAVETIMYNEYELGWEDLPQQEEMDFVTDVSDMFEAKIKSLYNHYKER